MGGVRGCSVFLSLPPSPSLAGARLGAGAGSGSARVAPGAALSPSFSHAPKYASAKGWIGLRHGAARSGAAQDTENNGVCIKGG